jgi:hypothetical protein
MRSWHAVFDRPRQGDVGRTSGSRLPMITVIMTAITSAIIIMMPVFKIMMMMPTTMPNIRAGLRVLGVA